MHTSGGEVQVARISTETVVAMTWLGDLACVQLALSRLAYLVVLLSANLQLQ